MCHTWNRFRRSNPRDRDKTEASELIRRTFQSLYEEEEYFQGTRDYTTKTGEETIVMYRTWIYVSGSWSGHQIFESSESGSVRLIILGMRFIAGSAFVFSTRWTVSHSRFGKGIDACVTNNRRNVCCVFIRRHQIYNHYYICDTGDQLNAATYLVEIFGALVTFGEVLERISNVINL